MPSPRPVVDFTGAKFPSDTILRTSEALKAVGLRAEAEYYREVCLDAWENQDKQKILDETAKLVKAK